MATHKSVQVNLDFKANTSQVQQSILNLQTSLNNIANTKIAVEGGSIDTAAQSAKMLSEHLAKATNVTTGKIDFTALSNSLKNANTDLATLSNNLLAMGPKGQQAFSQIANAVAHAELSTRKANKTLQNFGITLMNTIKWQAASSMIHGVMGAFNSAVSHIEKLDKSLNSIQIVSGKTSAEMASFAKQAQSAARALSSTTTEYSDAALIYFQQGLGEKAIAERTEATLKMAKVTGDSVATVSDQLTAIWNNFDDGSKSLEQYVDIITALGAATASSTDEIADGLQKFAAIAETVGLSYEYAATALATVTSETRQSADVVGTAFKTLFARIQGLNLGETLDDGTTLNKYSEALAKVGIDIKLSNGELKDMNDILDEMGDKWNRLNEDQQVALAQTVGGVRQYNQLIALMDNWDTFQINLEIAENSKGELDKQFEIYQTSIEASSAELKNATEALYENLLNPEMVTTFNSALTDAIDLVNTLIDNAGGVEELFKFGGLLLLQMVLPKLQGFLMNAATYMKDFIGYTKAAKMYELNTMAQTSHDIAGTTQRTAQHQATTSIGKAGQWLNNKASNLLDEAFIKTAGNDNPIVQQLNGVLYTATKTRNSVKQQTALSEAAFNPNAAAPVDVAKVDMNADAMTMRTQMIKEEAGYTATILDTKKQILALENGLTDKQREGYKAYNDQVAKEQEALRLAREKQAIAKDTADQSSRSGAMKVGSSKAGRDAKAAMKQSEIDQLEEERKKKIRSLTGDKESISHQTSEIDKEYNKKKEEAQNRHISNKTVDFKGDETRQMTEGFKDSGMSETGQSITQSMTDSLTQSADNSGPAASIENLEKLGQLQAQYNADAAKASGIYSELSGNIGEAGKRTEQQQKALKKTGDTMKSLGKDAKVGLVDSLKDSAKQMEKAGDSAEGLKKVIKSLEDNADIDLGELNSKEIDAVKKSVGNLDEGLTEASTSAGELANAMAQDMANATDQDVKIFTGIAEDAQTAKASALEADGAAKQLQTTLNTQPPIMPDPFGAVIQGATQATAAFTSFAMGAQMLSTGITTAFDENASAVERVMGAMMILQGVMSTVNAVQAAANAVDTFAVAIKAAKAAASAKEAAAESKGIIATVANTIATAANAVAKLFAAEASKGLAGVIAGVLGAALIAGTIAIVANTVATQQDTEAKQEEAAAAEESAAGHRENADALREETKELNKNADNYRKLYRAYQESGEVKSDLADATYELATSLGVENASLLILQGQYETLNAEIEKNLKLKNEEAMKAAKEATDAAGFSFATKAGAGEGYWADDGDNDGQYTTGLWADTSNTAWINDYLNSDKGKKYSDAGIKFVDGKLMADYDINDPSQLAEIWALMDEMLANGSDFWQAAPKEFDITNSTLQKSFRTMKEKMGDTYTQMIEAPQAELEQALITGVTHTGLNNATDLDSFGEAYTDYIEYVKEQAGPFADSAKVMADAQDYLRKHSSYGELFQQYEAFTQLPDAVRKMAENEGWTKDKDTLSLLLTTYFPEDVTVDQIKALMELGQRMLDNSELTAQIKFIPTLGDQLKDEMSKEDWDKWFAEWEKQGLGDFESVVGVSKSEFMGMSAARGQALLDSITPTNDIEVANNEIDLLKEQRDIIADAGYEYVDTNYLSYQDLDFAKAWVANKKEDGTIDVDAMMQWMQSQGLAAEEPADVLEYAANLFNQQPYQFGHEAKSIDEYFNREIAKDKSDQEATNENREAYDGALAEWDTKIEAATQEVEFLEATAFKRKAVSLDLEVAEVEEFAEALKEIPLVETEEEAQDLSIQITQMKRGLTTLAENWDDWSQAIKDGDLDAKVKAISGVKKALGDLTGIDMNELPMSFFESEANAKLLEEAVKGDEQAINDLMAAATKEIILQMNLSADTESALQTLVDNTIDAIEVKDLTVGASLEASGMYQGFQDLLNSGAVTVDQMNSILKGIGFNPEIEMKKIPIDNAVANADGNTYTVEYLDTEGNVQKKTISSQQYNNAQSVGYIEVPVINGDTSSYTGGGGSINKEIKNKSGGGGGGSSKKAEKVKKSDIVERYKEVNDLMDDLTDKMEDASKAADRLYGKGRIDQMKKSNELLKQEIELTKKKKEEALKYLDEDKQAMFDAASEAGVKLNIDENGLITNYTAAMTELYKELDEEITSANKDGSADEKETERIDAIQKRIDELKDAIDQYDETRELIEDLDNELDEQFYQWQDTNYEILTYELEIKLELNEDELKLVDYHLNKIADDFYQMAEAAALMVNSEKSLTGGSQLDVYKQNLEDYQAQKEALDEAYINNEISQDAYIEGLREIQDGMLSNLESLNELDDSMMHYYGETLNMAMEEMAKYTERMEHLTSVLDHYQSLMEIMGKSTDYESMGVVLEGKAKTLEHQTDVAKQAMEMYKTEADERYAAYQQALLDGDSAAAELYLQQYEDALAAANQAEEEYLASAEEWAEALTAVLENKLSELGQTLENALTGGTSFDQLTTSMERAAALQEEYLTTTNKIYETNKLMRQAQQEIDKTSNTVAKRRLQSFIQETNQLQNQTKLSNYELEIQQAKYDLLLAEIALEEAQNAKSTVRLQRDNEGNFGYVYTADGAAVAEAEQDMLDKQNRLYNLALDGANEYSEKYQQTLNEMYDTLTDLQQQYLDGAFETEQEYHAAVEAAKQYYYEKLQQYSSLHTVAITLDTRVINDAWSSGFNDMIANTEEWMGAVDIYINQVGDAFTRWGEYMDQIAADTGTDLDSLEENVKDITDESEALKETLIGEDGVVDAIQAQIDAVVDAVEKYATLRSSLQELKTGYEEVAAAIRDVVAAQSQVNTTPPVNNTTYTSDEGGRDGSITDNLDTGNKDNGGNPTYNPGGKNPDEDDEEENKNPPLPNRAITYAYQSRGKYYTYKSASEAAKKAPSDTSAIYMTKDKRISNDTIWAFVGFAGDLTSASFDTGGYTGQWGSYGKMAMLHEKELVLNKGDTENFLTAMGVLDRIVQTIDLQSANAQLGGLLMSPTLGYNRNDVLEQNIKIEASFPNATDKIEIEEAFMSLANLASQYANRK